MTLNKDDVTTIIDNITITANGSSSASTGVDLSQAVDFDIQFQITFNASAVGVGGVGARIDLYSNHSSASFTVGSFDQPCDSADVLISSGHQVNGSFQMKKSSKYVKAKIVNLDPTYSITGASLWATVQKP